MNVRSGAGGGRSAIQMDAGVDAVTAGGGKQRRLDGCGVGGY